MSSSSSFSSCLFTKGCASLVWLRPVRRIRPFSNSAATAKPTRLSLASCAISRSMTFTNTEEYLIQKEIQHPQPLAPTLCNHNVNHRRLFSSSFVSQQAEASITTDTKTPLFKFQDMVDLHPASKAALEKMGLERATEIQTKTWPISIKGQDILGRARTGTGKTLAFLLPSLERIVQSRQQPKIRMLVLSPTRELALQIANETRTLVTAHNQYSAPSKRGGNSSLQLTHQVMVGGSSRIQDVQKLEQNLPDILVATPGRLADHLQNTSIGEHTFASLLHDIDVLVLDETDRLLDSGFRQEVETILSHLSTDKQTLLFSATLPPEVRSILQQNLKPNFETIDCIHESDTATHVHPKVSQSHVVLPNMDTLVRDTIQLLMKLISSPKNNKIIVFFPTTHLTRFYAQIFNFGLGVPVLELHSKKSQSFRISVSNRFRELPTGVLFTSDVSARGVDYPNVTHVVQVGMAETRQAYVHRLGRTARAHREGEGLLILNPLEQGFLTNQLKGFDILPNEEMEKALTEESDDDDQNNALVRVDLESIWNSIRNGDNATLFSSAQDAYRSMLGFYLGRLPQVGIVKQHKQKLVHLVNSFSNEVGMVEPPCIKPKTAQNMGLANIAGIRIGHHYDSTSSKYASHKRLRQKKRRSLARVQQQWGRVDERLYDDWGRSVDTSK